MLQSKDSKEILSTDLYFTYNEESFTIRSNITPKPSIPKSHKNFRIKSSQINVIKNIMYKQSVNRGK